MRAEGFLGREGSVETDDHGRLSFCKSDEEMCLSRLCAEAFLVPDARGHQPAEAQCEACPPCPSLLKPILVQPS